MSEISLKSITGITSITTPAGVDNRFSLYNFDSTERLVLDHSGNLNISGVTTATNFKTGSSNLHSAGLNVQDLDVDGHTNLDNITVAGVSTFTGASYFTGGNVGIGTDNPSHELDIESVSPVIEMKDNDAGDSRFQIAQSGAQTYLDMDVGNLGSSSLRFRFAGEERVRFTTAGLVGIGTDNPTAPLQINHASPKIILEDNDNGADVSIANIGGAAVYSSSSDVVFQTADTSERLRINSSGQLLLGTTTPGAAQVDTFTLETSGHTGMTLFSGTSSRGTIAFGDGRSGNAQYRGVILYEHSNDSMRFATADTTQMNISSTGQITKPSHPAFFARPPATYSLGQNVDAHIGGTWSTGDSEAFVRGTLTNGTSVWNNTNGIFTVPVTGIYYFHLNLFMRNNTTRRDALIYRNGTSDIIARTEIGDPGEGSNNKSVSVSAVVLLSVNDTIRFGGRTVGGTELYTSVKPWSYACGYLIA